MKKWLFLFIVILTLHTAKAQSVDYETIIPTDTALTALEDRLLRTAWENYPENDAAMNREFAARKNVTLTRWAWTNNLRVFYNVNDRTLEDVQVGQPQYGLGIGLNLGDFITLPVRTNIAKANHRVAKNAVDEQKLYIRREVLTRYYNYQSALAILKVIDEENEEVYTNYLVISEKFKQGEATLDNYTMAEKNYHEIRIRKITQENEVKLARLNLEEMIGIPLETLE